MAGMNSELKSELLDRNWFEKVLIKVELQVMEPIWNIRFYKLSFIGDQCSEEFKVSS